MSIETLNKDLINRERAKRGVTRKWLIAQLGLSQDNGYKFLRGKWMPEDPERKSELVRALAKLLNVSVTQILVRYEAREAS